MCCHANTAQRDCRQSTQGAACIYARATEHKTAEYYSSKVPQRCRSSSTSQAGSPCNRQPGLKMIVVPKAARGNEKTVLLLLPVKDGCWYVGAAVGSPKQAISSSHQVCCRASSTSSTFHTKRRHQSQQADCSKSMQCNHYCNPQHSTICPTRGP